MLVFTNLTQDHLDFHGTMEDYFESKRRLFAQAERAVINVGDATGQRLAAELPGCAHVRRGDDELSTHRAKLRGRFNSRTPSRAAAAARALGIDEDAIKHGLESVAACPGRFDRSTRDSRSRSRRLRAHAGRARDRPRRGARARRRRVICVFGCRRRPRPGQAAADGPDRRGARRRRDRHLRQSAQRGSRCDRRGGRRGAARRSRSSSTVARRSSARSSRRARATSS